MKLSHDLVRGLLLAMEEHLPHHATSASAHHVFARLVKGDAGTVLYHFQRMKEGGLITLSEQKYLSGERSVPIGSLSLTWAGHQFLDDVRDESRWEKIKGEVGPVSLATMKAMLPEVVKALVLGSSG